MDQHTLAGVGNIYADEILFQAKIHPTAIASKLDKRTQKRLYHTMNRMLKKAIAKNADPEKMPKGFLLRHRGKGETVKNHEVKQIAVQGRTGYYCPAVQKKP